MVVLIAGIIGNLFGMFLGVLFPDGALDDLLAKSFSYGFDPPIRLDLWIVSFSIGFQIKLNVCSLIFMFFGFIFYKRA